MLRPRMIATRPVLERLREILAADPIAAQELDALLVRTRTIFEMDLLSYKDEAPTVGNESFIDSHVDEEAANEATPLDFLPSVDAFSPGRRQPADIFDGGLHPEGLGLEPKGFKPIEIAKAGLSRMQALGTAWLLRGDADYARRGVDEMLALCKLKHWGGKHHLAVATIMQALAIGYDWLHDEISEADKATIRQALIDKGFVPMREAFKATPQPNWISVPSNWNIVCNASLIMAALAIDQDTNDTSVPQMKLAAVESLAAGLRLFDDDGSWKLEGPGYWHLATEHLAYLQSALDTAADPAASLLETSAVANTGLYRCYMSGPSALLFNFGDSEEQRPGLWWMRWFGTRYGQPVFHELAEDRTGNMGAAQKVHPMDLLWRRMLPGQGAPPLLTQLPTARVFSEAAVMRGAWGQPTAAYVGIKGGETSGLRSHSHLDLGHFVYEVGGRRWAIDLGPDDYTECYLAPPERYKYYRANTFGHNTLVIDGVNQAYVQAGANETAIGAVFSALIETEHSSTISIDLSAAYTMAASVKRTFTLCDQGGLTIIDEMAPRNGQMEVVWSMHTRAEVTCDGRHARLQLPPEGAADGQAMILYVSLDGPEGAIFQCVDAGAAVPYWACDQVEASNPGIKRLLIDLGTIRADTRLQVRFSITPE